MFGRLGDSNAFSAFRGPIGIKLYCMLGRICMDIQNYVVWWLYINSIEFKRQKHKTSSEVLIDSRQQQKDVICDVNPQWVNVRK